MEIEKTNGIKKLNLAARGIKMNVRSKIVSKIGAEVLLIYHFWYEGVSYDFLFQAKDISLFHLLCYHPQKLLKIPKLNVRIKEN